MAGDGGAVLEVVGVALAGFRFAIEATAVMGLRRLDDGDDRWPALETLLGLPVEAGAERRLLMLRGTDAQRAVTVPAGVALDRVPARAIHPLPVLAAARVAVPAVAALAFDEAGLIVVVDPRRLRQKAISGSGGPGYDDDAGPRATQVSNVQQPKNPA